MAGDSEAMGASRPRYRLHHPRRPRRRPARGPRPPNGRLPCHSKPDRFMGYKVLQPSGHEGCRTPRALQYPRRDTLRAAPRRHLPASASRGPTNGGERVRDEPADAQCPLRVRHRGPAPTRATASRRGVACRTSRTNRQVPRRRPEHQHNRSLWWRTVAQIPLCLALGTQASFSRVGRLARKAEQRRGPHYIRTGIDIDHSGVFAVGLAIQLADLGVGYGSHSQWRLTSRE